MSMQGRARYWRWVACLVFAIAGAQGALAAGYERLSRYSENVLKNCNLTDSSLHTKCRVASLPGESGYVLVASRSAPLIYNDVIIGTLYEKVWRKALQPKLYIFGMRVVMNDEQWDASGKAFNVNDLFRQTLPNRRVSIAYYQADATKALRRSGRTVQGLNEYEGDEPERNNTWVDFRVDVNAADPDGVSSPKSPWLLTKTRAPAGIVLNALGIRVLNSDVPDILDAVEFFTAGYQPDGVPPPEDDDDDDDEDDE